MRDFDWNEKQMLFLKNDVKSTYAFLIYSIKIGQNLSRENVADDLMLKRVFHLIAIEVSSASYKSDQSKGVRLF